MSYCKKIEYEIVPEQSFAVLRSCSGCGVKTGFVNTGRFRVNANGNKLDVWLIYQCGNCKHTLNIPIYERRKPEEIPRQEYQAFLENDETLAERYGRNAAFFSGNRLVVDEKSISYRLVEWNCEAALTVPEPICGELSSATHILLHNPCSLPIRPERLAAEALGLSRSQIKKRLEAGDLSIEKKGGIIELTIFREINEERSIP